MVTVKVQGRMASMPVVGHCLVAIIIAAISPRTKYEGINGLRIHIQY